MAVIDIKIDTPVKVDIPLADAFNSASESERKEVIKQNKALVLDALPWYSVLAYVRSKGCFIYTTPKEEKSESAYYRQVRDKLTKAYGISEIELLEVALGYLDIERPIIKGEGESVCDKCLHKPCCAWDSADNIFCANFKKED